MRSKTKAMDKYFFLLWIALFLSVGCMEKRDESSPVLYVQMDNEPDKLHPVVGISYSRAVLLPLLHKSLLKRNPKDGRLEPELLAKLPDFEPDGLKAVLELKEDLFWSNGKPITAYDVLFTLKVYQSVFTPHFPNKDAFLRIHHLKVLDSLRFEIVFNQKHFMNEEMLTNFLPLSANFWDEKEILQPLTLMEVRQPQGESLPEWAAWFNDFHALSKADLVNTAGSGDYVLEEVVPKKRLILSKVEAKADGKPQKMVFIFEAEQAKIKAALKGGYIDVSTRLKPALFQHLTETQPLENYQSKSFPQYSYRYLAFNMRPDLSTQSPFFVEREVREAIRLLLPFEEILSRLYDNKAERQFTFVSTDHPDYNEDLPKNQENMALARERLKQAGWERDGARQVLKKKVLGEDFYFEPHLNYVATPELETLAKLIRSQLAKVGIKVVLNPMPLDDLYKYAFRHDFDFMLGAWSYSGGPTDPEPIWHTRHHENNGYNFTGFGNAQTDALIEKANTTMNKSKRSNLLKSLQMEIHQEVPYVFLFSENRNMLVHQRWEGVTFVRERPGLILEDLRLAP